MSLPVNESKGRQIQKFGITAVGYDNRPHTLSEYLTFSRTLLEKLQEIHPLFRRLAVLGKDDYQPISEDLEGLDALIVDGAIRSADNLKDCQNLAPDGLPGPDTTNNIGFRVSYFSYADDAERSHRPVHEGGIKLTIRGSDSGCCSYIGLALPSDGYCDLHEPAMVRRLLALIAEHQRGVTYGRVGSYDFTKALEQDQFDLFAGEWLLYFKLPQLSDCLPDDISHEPFLDGVLLETTPHPPQVENPTDIAAGKRMYEVLDELGLMRHCLQVLNGWPHDEEETRYQQVLTGAPEGRKYRVGCVDFDGYDAERKTLLFTRLFRGLKRYPKGWGIRGLDGPVLNEANRQVNAAQGYPIEWHIGLEEPYEKVRELLADYTDITEEQIRVIYTPLEPVLRNFDQESDKNHT